MHVWLNGRSIVKQRLTYESINFDSSIYQLKCYSEEEKFRNFSCQHFRGTIDISLNINIT